MKCLNLPTLIEQRCVACGDCVRVCPAQCLEKGPVFPWLPRPRSCTSCGLCARVCPAEAIRIAPVSDAAAPWMELS